MNEENVVQPDYTTVQLRRDLLKRVRFLAVRSDTNVKTEIEKAVQQYLDQNQHDTAAVPQ